VQVDDAASLGRVDVEQLADGSAVVAGSAGDGRAAFKVRRVERSGQRSGAITVTDLGASRKAATRGRAPRAGIDFRADRQRRPVARRNRVARLPNLRRRGAAAVRAHGDEERAAGMVSTHAHTIWPATPQRTADRRRTAPTPTIAPVIACVVLTARRSAFRSNRDRGVGLGREPADRLQLGIFDPMVQAMRQRRECRGRSPRARRARPRTG
jgi:hypothetical protein